MAPSGFEAHLIALEPDKTKNREGRSVPILKGDMRDLLLAAKRAKDENWPDHLGSSIAKERGLLTSKFHRKTPASKPGCLN